MSGQQLKLRGIDRVAQWNRDWLNHAAMKAGEVVEAKAEFTSDDVRVHVVFYCGNPGHPNAWGALLNSMAKSGRIRRIGYRPSTLPSTHGRIVSVWEGVK